MAHRLSQAAEADLDEIWLHVTEHSSAETADRLVDRLTGAFLMLARHPFAGRARDDLRAGYRSFPMGNYLVRSRMRDRDVLILRVLHGHRDVDATI